MADPDNGFGLYAASQGGWVVGGGTSAAAPLVAGHLAAALSSAGRTTGVGDIHDELYASPAAFRDVTSGTNLLYAAAPGYDLATGLGSPRWSAFANVLFGDPVVAAPAAVRTTTVPLTVTPVAGMTVTAWTAGEGTTVPCEPAGSPTAPTAFTLPDGPDRNTHVAVAALDANGACHVGTAPVLLDTHAPAPFGAVRSYTGADARTTFTWGASETVPTSGLAAYDVCVYAYGYGCTWSSHTTGRTVTLSLVQGRTYLVRVRATDRAGNTATANSAAYTVPVDSRSFTKTTGWTARTASPSWYGSYLLSTRSGATASRSLAGTRYEVLYVAHPRGGVMDVYVGGHLAKRISTYASTTQYRRVVLAYAYSTRKARTVSVVARGANVAFDAVRVAY
jgi:hypothetical protein